MPETLLTYANKRYLWGTVIGAVVLLLSYFYYAGRMIPFGGTAWGLVYGWMGLISILVLMLLGIRKRWYSSRLGTLEGWTSAHVYLGLLALLIIPLHAGFHFGWNVHTFAYVLLVIVVLSGVLGIVIYLRIPIILTGHESGMLPDRIETAVNQILKEMRQLASDNPGLFQVLYDEEVRRCRALKHWGWRILFTRVDSDAILARRMHDLRTLFADIPPTEQENFSKFTSLVLQKTHLEAYLAGQMRLKNALQSWLYVHVPASIALVAAVSVHLVVILYY